MTPAVWKKLSFHHFMVFQAREVFIADKQSGRADRASSHLGGQHLQRGRRGSPPFLILKRLVSPGFLVVNVASQMPAAPVGIKLCEAGSLQLRDPLPPGQACMSPERWGRGLLAGAEVELWSWAGQPPDTAGPRPGPQGGARGRPPGGQKPEASASGCVCP